MSLDPQQAISHVLQQDSPALGNVLHKINQLRDMQQILSTYLTDKLAPHCKIANFEQNCLVVITDTALWATQFRFQTPTLLTQLRQHEILASLQEIQCKIRPPLRPDKISETTQTPSLLTRLSKQTALALIATAQTIKYNSLKKIMEKIAAAIEKPNE